MENNHIYVSDSERQYIFAKSDIVKITKLYDSRFYYRNKCHSASYNIGI